MSFDFEPHQFHSRMKILSPSRLWKKGLKATGENVSTQIFTSFRYSLHGSGIEEMLFRNQKECYTTCMNVANS